MTNLCTIVGFNGKRQLEGCLLSCKEAGVIPVVIFKVGRTDFALQTTDLRELYIRLGHSRSKHRVWSFNPATISTRLKSRTVTRITALVSDPSTHREVVDVDAILGLPVT